MDKADHLPDRDLQHLQALVMRVRQGSGFIPDLAGTIFDGPDGLDPTGTIFDLGWAPGQAVIQNGDEAVE